MRNDSVLARSVVHSSFGAISALLIVAYTILCLVPHFIDAAGILILLAPLLALGCFYASMHSAQPSAFALPFKSVGGFVGVSILLIGSGPIAAGFKYPTKQWLTAVR